MELRHHWHPLSAARSWLAVCLALLVLVPAVSTQGSFQFLQPLPTPVQCQTYEFAWTGGTPTYTLSVSVSQPWDASYGIGPLDGQGFSWVMPFPAGHTVSFELRDNAGHVARAGPLTIQPSGDTSCIDSTEVTPSSEASSSTTTTSSKTASSTTIPGSSRTGTPTTASTTATAPTGKPQSMASSASASSTPSDSSFTPSVVSLSPTSQPQYTRDGNGSMSVITTIVITPTTSASDASPSPPHATLSTGSIAGVAVGGAAVLVLVGFVVWFCRRRRGERRRRRRPSLSSSFGALAETKASTIDSDTMSRLRFGGSESDAASPTSTTQRLRPCPLPLPLSTPSSPSSPGSDPFSAVSPTSTQRLRPGPRPGPGPGPLSLADPSSPSSPGSESDPFSPSLSDGSRRFILPAESEDYVPASYDEQWRWDGAARSRTRSACESPVLPPSPLGPVSAGIPNLNRPLAGPRDDSTLASSSPDVAAIDAKRDFPPRDLPMPPPSHPPPPRSPDSEAITPHHAAPPTDSDGRSAVSMSISTTGPLSPAHLMRFEEDGGVRLAGGLPGEVLDDDGSDVAGGWLVQPPPYQRFR